jgi:hypothetical protein
MLKASSFSGPITTQHEYPFESETVEGRTRAFKADCAQVRAWIKDAK